MRQEHQAPTCSLACFNPAAPFHPSAAPPPGLFSLHHCARQPARKRACAHVHVCMCFHARPQDASHHSFAAALATHVEMGLAAGSGTGDVLYLDFVPRGSSLPPLHAARHQQQHRRLVQHHAGGAGAGGRSAFVIRF